MGKFITLISLKIAHSYYHCTSPDKNFNLSPTPETKQLARRRGILPLHGTDGFQWMIADDCAGFINGDTLELSLINTDSNFLRITKMEGYHPQSFYLLTLGSEREVNIPTTLKVTNERKWQPELCRLSIPLTDSLLQEAKADKPMEYTLRFQSMAYRWEYLFIVRNKPSQPLQNILLEESKNRIVFENTEKLENHPFGNEVWRTTSAAPVSTLEHPEYTLTLSEVLTEHPQKKRIVSRFIPCPQPGQYQTDEPDVIRQICYL